MAKTKERHFEDAIEHRFLTSGGWTNGSPSDFDRHTALVPKALFAFIESTQLELWADPREHGLEPAVLAALLKALDLRGFFDALRHGFTFLCKQFDLLNGYEAN